jgi:hypothetical protein
MSERIEFTSDENKLNLTAGDLFDRIINLKINCINNKTNELESFVIRSDYELVYSNVDLNNFTSLSKSKVRNYTIRRCTFKPSIKVQCKMVTSNTATSVDIFIHNFFMLSKDGKYLRSFNSQQYSIKSVDIAMGYWGQFKDTLNPDSLNAIQQYFDIKAENGADMISISSSSETPIVVTTDKLPPDSILHLHGYVADIYGSPVSITNIDSAQKMFTKPSATSGSTLESIFFDSITRRYINPHTYMDNKAIGTLNIKRLTPVTKDSKVEFIRKLILDPNTNQMSIADAKQYGVKVYLSDGASKSKIKRIYDSENNEKDRKIYFEDGWTIGQTITRIMTFIDAELEFTFTLEGNVLIYTPQEMIENIQSLNDTYKRKGVYKDTTLANKTWYNNALPAVYNINIDSVATIVCPFFTFIEPFQYVEFASRYALTSTVAYYASYKPTIYRFLVISASISFATEEAINEVQLTAVSARDSIIN